MKLLSRSRLIPFLGGVMISLLFSGAACFAETEESTLSPFLASTAAERVSVLLWNCPSWYFKTDDDTSDFIMRRCFDIGRFSDGEIRAGISIFLNEVQQMPPTLLQDEQRAKVALLNRLIFAVPDVVSGKDIDNELEHFTWLVPKSPSDHTAFAVFPLLKRKDGSEYVAVNLSNLQLRPNFVNVLSEFDYFRVKYGRSALTLRKDGRVERQAAPMGTGRQK